MQYDNSQVRRQDRLLAEARAREILEHGEYGFLALGDTMGGYGIPVIMSIGRGSAISLRAGG